jgi:hypothetical protein
VGDFADPEAAAQVRNPAVSQANAVLFETSTPSNQGSNMPSISRFQNSLIKLMQIMIDIDAN